MILRVNGVAISDKGEEPRELEFDGVRMLLFWVSHEEKDAAGLAAGEPCVIEYAEREWFAAVTRMWESARIRPLLTCYCTLMGTGV
jgi:hypothetical protein